MKSVLASTFTLFLFSSVSAVQLTWDPVFSNSSNSLANVACSDGPNGLLTMGFITFGSLPTFPYIGGVPAITNWNDPDCGSCWTVTYIGDFPRSIHVLGIDVGTERFVISPDAMNDLTGGHAVDLGSVQVTSQQVAASVCGF